LFAPSQRQSSAGGLTGFRTTPVSSSLSGQDSGIVFRQDTFQAQDFAPAQRQTTRQTFKSSEAAFRPTPSKAAVPALGAGFPPIFGGGTGGRKGGKKTKQKQKSNYAASFTARIFKIYAKKGGKKAAGYSGIEIRGI
jgi:hypothetical protein